MTAFVFLALTACLWFCYVALNVFVALWGPDRAPSRLVRMFGHTRQAAASGGRRWAALVGAGASMVVGIVPEIAVAREVILGKTNALETTIVALGLIVCVVWFSYLVSQYRASARPADGS